jgi:hypothetical protein
MHKVNNKFFIFVLLLIVPIFFNLQDGLYIGQNFKKEKILELPLPISFFVFTLIFIITFFINKKKNIFFFKEKIVQVYLVSFFLIVFINIFYFNLDYERTLYLLQFFLPLLGLFVGYFFFNNFFFLITYRILFIFFSIHLLGSLLQGKNFLNPYLYFFQIYQNFQYVNPTLIFLACTSLMMIREQIYKINFYLFICLIFIYSFYAYSFSSIIIFFVSFIFLFKSNFNQKKLKYLFLSLFFLSLFFIFIQRNNTMDKKSFIDKNNINYFNNYQKFTKILNFELPESVSLRARIWNVYVNDIWENNSLFFGSRLLDLDKKYSGAHNLFIDSIYKFGILLAIPFFYLFIFIIFSIIKESDSKKKKILIIFFLFLLIENFFKTSLKQPYSGIISYYIFAILLFPKKKP